MSTTLYIIRHGQSEENVDFTLEKSISVDETGHDLTVLGLQQATALAEKFAHVPVDYIYSSHLLRAVHTAEILAQNKGLLINIDKDFQERIVNLDRETMEKIWLDHTLLYGDTTVLSQQEQWKWKPYETMESEEEAVGRLVHALRKVVKLHKESTICVVSHGQIMRSFLVYLSYRTFKDFPLIRDGSISNTAYIKLNVEGDMFTVTETSGILEK